MGSMEHSPSSRVEIGVPIDLREVSQGISGVAQRKPSQLSLMMGKRNCSDVNAGELVITSS